MIVRHLLVIVLVSLVFVVAFCIGCAYHCSADGWTKSVRKRSNAMRWEGWMMAQYNMKTHKYPSLPFVNIISFNICQRTHIAAVTYRIAMNEWKKEIFFQHTFMALSVCVCVFVCGWHKLEKCSIEYYISSYKWLHHLTFLMMEMWKKYIALQNRTACKLPNSFNSLRFIRIS